MKLLSNYLQICFCHLQQWCIINICIWYMIYNVNIKEILVQFHHQDSTCWWNWISIPYYRCLQGKGHIVIFTLFKSGTFYLLQVMSLICITVTTPSFLWYFKKNSQTITMHSIHKQITVRIKTAGTISMQWDWVSHRCAWHCLA